MSSRRTPGPITTDVGVVEVAAQRSANTAIGGYGSRLKAGTTWTLHGGQVALPALRPLIWVVVQSLPGKLFALRFGRNGNRANQSCSHQRGVSRSSRTLDAGCGGRGSVGCASARGRTALTRTAKSCGPDIPTLMSSS